MPSFHRAETRRHRGRVRRSNLRKRSELWPAPDHGRALVRSSETARTAARARKGRITSERFRSPSVRPSDGRDSQEDRAGERLAAAPGGG